MCINTYSGWVYENEWNEVLLNSAVAVTNWTWPNSTTDPAFYTAVNYTLPPGSNGTFRINYPAFQALFLMNNLGKLFDGQIFSNGAGELTFNRETLLPLFFTDAEDVQKAPVNWVDADVPLVMSNLARSISKHLREQADPFDNQVLGTAWDVQIYMAVRWRWIALPVALHALTLCLLITTVALTAKKQLPPWKGSIFPLLRAKVGGGLSEGLLDATKLYGMERAVEKVRMELESGVGRAAFVPQRRGEHGEPVMLHAV